ncbi:MAG: hypothetical protein AB1894_12335 [Chloroflexota bacterium]
MLNSLFWPSIEWIIGGSILGFVISGLFAGLLGLARDRFLVAYATIAGVFIYGFIALNEIDVTAILAQNWGGGILVGALASIFLVRHVKSQPASRQTSRGRLFFDLSWAGLVYGLIDALFLNVMPVVAAQVSLSQFDWSGSIPGKISTGALGLFASLLIALTYHLGYPEFRNPKVRLVLVGNSIITLAYLVSGNPLASIISHTAMHLAAVWHGPETTIQLPPHYQTTTELN